jgi:hypothetical protein
MISGAVEVLAPTTEQWDVFHARIILLAAEGRLTRSIAHTLGTMPALPLFNIACVSARS